MFTSKDLGPYGGERFLAEGSGRHTEQDEAGHDDRGDDNSRNNNNTYVMMTTLDPD